MTGRRLLNDNVWVVKVVEYEVSLLTVPRPRRLRTAGGMGRTFAVLYVAAFGKLPAARLHRWSGLYKFRICGSSNAINLVPLGWLQESLCGLPCAISICANGKKFFPSPAG